ERNSEWMDSRVKSLLEAAGGSSLPVERHFALGIKEEKPISNESEKGWGRRRCSRGSNRLSEASGQTSEGSQSPIKRRSFVPSTACMQPNPIRLIRRLKQHSQRTMKTPARTLVLS